jgi:hypothetical protein
VRLFDAQDRLRRLRRRREALLDETFELVEGHRVEQSLTRRRGVYASHPAVVRMVEGTGLEAHVDPKALDVVFACDGRRPLRELVADERADAGTVLKAVRRLFELGFLVSTAAPEP